MAYGNLHYKGEPYRSSAYRDPFGTEDTHVRTHTNTHTQTCLIDYMLLLYKD